MNPRSVTILIVDDEAPNRRLLETLLSPDGYLTVTASSGEEALASVAQRSPDLILLDVQMPGINGFKVASLLKENPATSSIPIIFLTSRTDRTARLAGLQAGAEEFLSKPIDRVELILRVRNLLRLKSLSDQLLAQATMLEQRVESRAADPSASDIQFREMVESIQDVFFLRDAQTARVLYVSPTYAEIWGRACDEVYARPEAWNEAIHTEDRALVSETEQKAGGATGRFELEYRIVRPDGTIRWIEARAFPVLDRAGQTVRIAGVARDITARKEAADRDA